MDSTGTQTRLSALLLVAAITLAGCGGSSGPPTGPPVPVPDTLRTVTGRVAYHTVGLRLDQRDDYGRLLPVPGTTESTLPASAPQFPVEILSPAGQLLATAHSDDFGNYSVDVNFGQNPATKVIVRLPARIELPFGTVARAYASADAAAPYSVQTPPSGNPDERTMEVDLSVEISEGAAAYYILDKLYEGFLAARAGMAAELPDLDVVWAPGNGDRSYFEVVGDRGRLTVAGGITGDPASNQDAWDEPKLMRLFGEYVLGMLMVDIAPEGEPSLAPLVPSAAWREGFLDFWACVARDSREYWDTVGSGPQAHVVRFFDIESFFDPSLPPLAGNDPNVYQPASLIGLGSAASVAEMLWDIHDEDVSGEDDSDGIPTVPLQVTMRYLRQMQAGVDYPYLFTLFDRYVATFTLDRVDVDVLTRVPEDQGVGYPGTPENGCLWPMRFGQPGQPLAAIKPPYDVTLGDAVDTVTTPVNLEIGDGGHRYFLFDLAAGAKLTLTLTTTGNLVLTLKDLENNTITSGPSPLIVPFLEDGPYVIVVQTASDPQQADYDLRLQLTAP